MGAGRCIEVEEGDLPCLVPVEDQVLPGDGQRHDGAVHGETPDLLTGLQVPDPHRHVEAAGDEERARDGQSPDPATVTTAGVHPGQTTSRAGTDNDSNKDKDNNNVNRGLTCRP